MIELFIFAQSRPSGHINVEKKTCASHQIRTGNLQNSRLTHLSCLNHDVSTRKRTNYMHGNERLPSQYALIHDHFQGETMYNINEKMSSHTKLPLPIIQHVQ